MMPWLEVCATPRSSLRGAVMITCSSGPAGNVSGVPAVVAPLAAAGVVAFVCADSDAGVAEEDCGEAVWGFCALSPKAGAVKQRLATGTKTIGQRGRSELPMSDRELHAVLRNNYTRRRAHLLNG